MDNFEHIDEIVRQKFENFEPEPPLKVWENVRSNIDQTPPPSPHGLMLPIIFILTFFLFVGSLVMNLVTGHSDEDTDATFTASYVKTAGLISTGSTTTPAQTLEEAIYKSYQDNHLEEVMSSTSASIAPVPESKEIKVKAPFQPLDHSSSQAIVTGKTKKDHDQANATRGEWKPGLRQAIEAGEISVADAVKYNLSLKDIRKISGYQDYRKHNRPDVSVGLYFNPEVTKYRSEDIANTVSYSVGILPQVSFNHFFVQTGINARFTNDKGRSSVSYNRFLGTYDDVYLVTFDSTDNGVVPTYYTEVKEVYDTVDHYAITETRANYTYLEVPVLLGYRYEFGKLSVFAKGGPAASFLVSHNMPVQDPEENARIVNVDYQVPARSQVNWQLMIGAGIDYRLTNSLSFSLEPTFRHALKPEYKLPDDAGVKSNSFGIRVGFNYNF